MAKTHTSNGTYIAILAGIGAATILCCAAVATYYWNHTVWGMAVSQQDKALKEYRQAGLPWTADELKQDHHQGSANAGPMIQQSQKQTGIDRDRSKLELVNSELSSYYKTQKIAGINAAVSAAHVRLSEARRIGDADFCDFKRDYDEGAMLLLPEYAHMKYLVKLLVAAALVEASSGNHDAAVKDLDRALNISSMPTSDPVLISHMLSVSCYSISYQAVERAVELLGNDRKALVALAKALRDHKPDYSMRRVLQGEAYMGIAVIRNLKKVKPIGPEKGLDKWLAFEATSRSPKNLVRTGFHRNRVARAYMVRYMQTLTYLSKEEMNCPDLLVLGEKTDKYVASLRDKDQSYAFSTLMLPIFYSTCASVLECRAKYEVQAALVDVALYRASYSRFPASLSETQYKGVDPFTGKPLRYRKTAAGCLIYCLGVDKKDQGGLRKHERKASTDAYLGYDIAASFPACRTAK